MADNNKQMERDLVHDIKNGLAVIRMDAEVTLLGSPTQKEFRETLNRVISEIDRINELLKKP